MDLDNENKGLYTFNNFVISDSNKIAYLASFAISNSKSSLESCPCFIYGTSGTGKTHLLYSILNYIKFNDPERKVLYTTAKTFLEKFSRSYKKNIIQSKKLDYPSLIMIDNFEMIDENNYDKFFNFLNLLLVDSSKQIIVCSNKSINDDLLENFKIFNWLFIDIYQPEPKLKLDILRNIIKETDRELSDDILEFIANRSGPNLSELRLSLDKIFSYTQTYRKKVNLRNIRYVLDNLDTKGYKGASVEDINAYLAHYYNISVEDMLSNSKLSKFVKPRQIAIYLIKKLTNHNLAEIAKIFNKKDHTSIIYAIKLISQEIEGDKEIRNLINSYILCFGK